jgi:signal peptidase II
MDAPLRENGMKFPAFWGRLAPAGLALAALVFGLDQTVKWWLLNVVHMEERRQIAITSFFDLVMAWNHGVSYGLLTTNAQALLIIVSMLISTVLWLWLCRSDRPLAAVALGMIIGGALSNALDRATHGAVADFFLLHWKEWNWYVFNPADMAIVAGVAMLLYESLIEKPQNWQR